MKTTLTQTLITIAIFLTSCGQTEPQEAVTEEAPETVQDPVIEKEKLMEEFKADLTLLSDSAEMYFDLGLEQLEKGVAAEQVKAQIQPQVSGFQNKIDARISTYKEQSAMVLISEEESRELDDYLREQFKSTMQKHQELASKGVDL